VSFTLQKDNPTFNQKVVIRREALKLIDSPVIMETHGGAGKLFDACYSHLGTGLVFEKDPHKAGLLGLQRPTWAVYEADCEAAIADGVGSHLAVNLLDLDPYGDPWPIIDAFFQSDRPRPARLIVVVNDGLRHRVNMNLSWCTATLQPMVSKYGNVIYPIYLEICRELMTEKSAQAGYKLMRFAGYYTGHEKQMTHYLAVLNQ